MTLTSKDDHYLVAGVFVFPPAPVQVPDSEPDRPRCGVPKVSLTALSNAQNVVTFQQAISEYVGYGKSKSIDDNVHSFVTHLQKCMHVFTDVINKPKKEWISSGTLSCMCMTPTLKKTFRSARQWRDVIVKRFAFSLWVSQSDSQCDRAYVRGCCCSREAARSG